VREKGTYTGERAFTHEDRLHAVPIDRLWSGGLGVLVGWGAQPPVAIASPTPSPQQGSSATEELVPAIGAELAARDRAIRGVSAGVPAAVADVGHGASLGDEGVDIALGHDVNVTCVCHPIAGRWASA